MRSQEEINAEIAKLKEMKPTVRHFTAFHDDNHEAIDAQIRVLEKGMTEDEIYDHWDRAEADEHARSAALDAQQWRDGEERPDVEDQDATPSSGWEELIQ